MKTVQVLLSTYNGEKYLKEQLDSLINQEGINIKISVRDDGSTDSTRSILEEYRKESKLEYFVEKNVGYAKSFMTLASYCTDQADYYAFCDQDDLWESNKLISAVKKLEDIKEQKPKLYFSNLIVSDENLNKIGYKDYTNQSKSLGSAMVRFNISGCTMVFNNELLKLVLRDSFYKIKISHDSWMYKVCLSVGGEVVFDPNSYIKYRQHGNNVTGVRKGMKKRVYTELKAFTTDKNFNYKTARIILNEYSSIIPNDNLNLLNDIVAYKTSFIKRMKLIFNKKLKFNIKIIDIFNKIQILLGCY